MGKDYLVNLTKQKEQILYTDEYSNFEYDDISKIDKITFNMNQDELKKYIKNINGKVLRGNNFIFETSSTGKGYIYRPFINETKSKSEKYLDEFSKYIDERIERVDTKKFDKTCRLELARTSDFEEYVNEMLDDVIRGFIDGALPAYEMISVRSLMPNDIATHIVKVKNDYKGFNVSEKEKELRHISRSLTCYKSLRNFLMEYIRFKNNEYGGLNRQLYLYSNSIKNGKYYIGDKLMSDINEDIKKKRLV